MIVTENEKNIKFLRACCRVTKIGGKRYRLCTREFRGNDGEN